MGGIIPIAIGTTNLIECAKRLFNLEIKTIKKYMR
jgi:hypothetical protein